MIIIQRTSGKSTDFHVLTEMLDKELYSRYGELQELYDRHNFTDPVDNVVIGYAGNITAGCGSFKHYSRDTAEIKRMFVKPEFRGSGVAGMILLELEKWASEKGYIRSILETGIRQPEAIRFYIKSGYSIIDNYGPYNGNENSCCLSKKIG